MTMTPNLKKSQYIALFLAALVLSIPFNAANAYASLSITKNSGNASVDGFVNARGDIWTLEVLAAITGETIAPSQLKMNNFPFTQCNQVPGGSSACTYTVDFRTTPLPQTTVPINVQLFKRDGSVSDTQSTTLSFDSSAPTMSNIIVKQEGENILVRFTIKDEPQACSGLKKISFSEGITELKAYEGADLPQECQSAVFEKSFQFSSATAGMKTITIKAADKLGNERSVPAQFFYDNTKPSINASSFAIGNFRNFVPRGQVTAGFSVNVVEERTTLNAELTIPLLQINNEFTSCTKTEPAKNIFVCAWPARGVELGQPFSVTITARDGGNNTDTQTISTGFTPDTAKPAVDFFGTQRQFAAIHFTTLNNATIVARFTERESGMNTVRVAADLSELNPRYSRQARAQECINTGTQWECFWRGLTIAPNPDLTRTVRLVQAEDNVGNIADSLPTVDITVDIVAPNISEITWRPVGQTEGRDVAQSGDNIQAEFTILEKNGLSIIEADTSGIVSNGGMVNGNCALKPQSTDTYGCSLFIAERIKSGHSFGTVKISAQDTAGNRAQHELSIEIFGTADETTADFWERDKVSCSPKGLDVNVMNLAPQRVFCSVGLKTNAQDIELLSARLTDCTDPDHRLNRQEVINNFRGSTNPGIVLEFQQFEAESQNFSTQCTLRLQTKRGNQVVQQTEDEQVNITVPFFETRFDNALSTIEERIEDAKDEAENDLFKTVGVLNDILTTVRVICGSAPLLIVLLRALDITTEASDHARDVPPTIPLAVGMCEQDQETEARTNDQADYLQVLCTIASCDGKAYAKTGVLKAYGDWQKAVLDWYNWWSQKKALGVPAKSLYDNAVLSVVGICLPGIIYNVDKYRQIQCRYIYCLENEVKNGVATIESCRELKDYQECKYVFGELFQIIPFAGAIDQLMQKLKSTLTDPVGIALTAIARVCGIFCTGSGKSTTICNFIAFLMLLTSLVNSFMSAFNTYETISNDYCSQVL